MNPYVYDAKEFGKQMKIKGFGGKTLNPIMNNIIYSWEKELLNNSGGYEVSDIIIDRKDFDAPYADEDVCPNCGEQLITPATSSGYCLVVDGKIVIMSVYKQKTPIKINNAWWLKSAVEFTRDKNGSEKIHKRMKEFAGQQDIKKIIEAFVKRFNGEGTTNFVPEIRDFYFKYGYEAFF